MMDLLEPYNDILDVHFIEAVDGRKFSKEEINQVWDQKGTYAIYGREMKPTEIGCTLSHRKCCKELCGSNEKIALILEDDLVLKSNGVKSALNTLYEVLNTDEPMIILLSGDYWFTSKQRIGTICLATIREAVCSHAYLINRGAAEIVLSLSHKYLADDWYSLKKQGIRILGIYPHLADQNRQDFNTEVSLAYEGTIRKNLSFSNRLHSYYRAVVKRLLAYAGHIERKSFIN